MPICQEAAFRVVGGGDRFIVENCVLNSTKLNCTEQDVNVYPYNARQFKRKPALFLISDNYGANC